MSDEFFRKTFGDSESVHLGSGWVSGVSAVFLGLLGMGAVLCLRFPALLTLPEARAHYPMGVIRPLIQGIILAAFVFAAVSAALRERKVLALTGAALALAAAALGGGTVPLPQEVGTKSGIGLDWFVLDLFVMTIVFVPLERIWPLHPKQGTFRPEWTTDAFYFVWKKVSGDVTLSADIQWVGTSAAEHRKAVLIMRQSLDPGSPYADAVSHGNGLTSLQFRGAANEQTYQVVAAEDGPSRLRIVRKGSRFTMYFGKPGEELKPSGSVEYITLEEPFYVGLGVCSHVATTLETAIFSKVKLEESVPTK